MTKARYCVTEVKDCANCRGGSYPLRDTCPDCQGTGETQTLVPLKKALKESGYITFRDFSYMKAGLGGAKK